MQELLQKISLRELRLALLGIGAIITVADAQGQNSNGSES